MAGKFSPRVNQVTLLHYLSVYNKLKITWLISFCSIWSCSVLFCSVLFCSVPSSLPLFYLVLPHLTFSSSSQVISNPAKIAIHYLRGWFIIDLVAAIPFDLLLFGSTTDEVKFFACFLLTCNFPALFSCQLVAPIDNLRFFALPMKLSHLILK